MDRSTAAGVALVAAVCAQASSALAADYYVDGENGSASDSNPGTEASPSCPA